MNIQIEPHGGDRFFARLRTSERVFMWADFFSPDDARRWAEAHFDEAVQMEKKLLEDWPGGVESAHLGRRASSSNDKSSHSRE